MRRIKALMPSLKEKKRYMNIEIIGLEQNEEQKKFVGRPLNELVSKINNFLGVFDAAGAGIIPLDLKKNHALLRVSAKYVDRIKSVLLFINELGTNEVILITRKTSGSVNKARTY